MSVKELKFKDEDIVCKFEDDILRIGEWEFNRNEAHLLMLYLQEHLK